MLVPILACLRRPAVWLVGDFKALAYQVTVKVD